MTAKQATEILNVWLHLDREALAYLISYRVPISDELADHPHIVVTGDDQQWETGLLGILNGLLCEGSERIVAVYETKPPRLLRFEHKEVYP
jgi:hypothetical protein